MHLLTAGQTGPGEANEPAVAVAVAANIVSLHSSLTPVRGLWPQQSRGERIPPGGAQ